MTEADWMPWLMLPVRWDDRPTAMYTMVLSEPIQMYMYNSENFLSVRDGR